MQKFEQSVKRKIDKLKISRKVVGVRCDFCPKISNQPNNHFFIGYEKMGNVIVNLIKL